MDGSVGKCIQYVGQPLSKNQAPELHVCFLFSLAWFSSCLQCCGEAPRVAPYLNVPRELTRPSSLPSRHEFDSEQIPDLTRDVFRQDIHSVGSLCKLYFRELPNPLLTYQLYDRFSVRISATGAGISAGDQCGNGKWQSCLA